MMSGKYVKRATAWLVVGALLSPFLTSSSSGATLDDLKKLEITCFVPSYLPHGLRLKRVEITYEESNDADHPLSLYSLEYSNGWNATFSVEAAREGIGDRNLMKEENTEETEIPTPLGPMYLIYRPKGQDGRKDEIKANWVSDANMNAEKANDPQGHPVLGRYHGFSATGITLKEFTKIVQSLHPVVSQTAAASAASATAAAEQASVP